MLSMDVHEGVATLTLRRPDALNAIDDALCDALHAAWACIETDEAIRCAVLQGSGPRAFCAGADLREADPQRDKTSLGRLCSRKPVIASIHGYTLGAGLELALLCDIRIASDCARLGFPEVGLGIVPAAGGTQRAMRTLASSDALLLLLSGDTVDAAEALRMGLVSRVVARTELEDTSQSIAARIAAHSPQAVRALKRLTAGASTWGLSEGLAQERDALLTLRAARLPRCR